MRNLYLHHFFTALVVITAIYCLTCTKRDNPFDPVNYREQALVCPPESLITLKTNVLLQVVDADQSMLAVQAVADTIWADSSIKYAIFSANGVIAAANQKKRDQNLIIDSLYKNSTIIDSLRLKSLLDTLSLIVINQAYNDTFTEKKGRIETSQLKAMTLIAGFESSCSGNKAPLQTFKDSVTAIIKKDSSMAGDLSARSNSLIQSLNDSSLAIARYNAAIIIENAELISYNANISWRIKTNMLHHIKTPDSLLAFIARAVPGDTFVIEGELTTKDLVKFDTSGTALQPIVFMGTPQMTSIINATGGIIITNRRYISLVNLVIRNSAASGFKVESGAGSIVLDNCIVRDNTLYGVEAIDSDLRIVNCKIMHNGKSGLRFSPTTINTINLDNVLIVKNHAHGIELVSPYGDLNYVTISNNDSSGINIPTFNNTLNIYNSLITYNNDFGVKATILPGNAGLITLRNDNFYGNPKGDIDTTGHYSYFTLEPGYSDTANDDFSINPNGPMQGLDIGYREKK